MIKDGKETIDITNLAVCSSMQRINSSQYEPTNLIEVKVVCVDDTLDWAILQRTDDKTFETGLPIAKDQTPLFGTGREIVSIFYYPITTFNQLYVPILGCFKISDIQVLCITERHLILSKGNESGSSGSPYISENGSVVAMHVDSYNTIITPEDVIHDTSKKTTNKRKFEMVHECLKSITENTTEYATGLTICRLKLLLEKLSQY